MRPSLALLRAFLYKKHYTLYSMKGYVTGNKLYIFDEAGQIPYVDAAVEIIYVQQEYLEAFKEANSDYASLMKPYNFQMLTVKAKEWSGHTNDDITSPEPEVQTYTLALVTDAFETNPIQLVWDNNTNSEVNLSAVPAGHQIQVNLNDGFTFIEGEREGILVNAMLTDENDEFTWEPDEVFSKGPHYVTFTMPEQNARLVIN